MKLMVTFSSTVQEIHKKSKVIPRDSKTKVAEASCVADFGLQWKGLSALATVLAIMNEGG